MSVRLSEPATKRTTVFVDGQNLFHAARRAFGYTDPNYDVAALASALCCAQGWTLSETRFYTGIHDQAANPGWNRFWVAKLVAMGRQGVHVYSRRLQYRNVRVKLPDGSIYPYPTALEKGIDVRIAVDIIRLATRGEYDVALVLSQDQDLSEAAEEIRAIAREHGRWLKIASAYPFAPTVENPRGINKTDWIQIDRTTYDACLDHRDYFA